MDPNRNQKPNNSGDEKRPKGNIWVTLVITVAIILLFSTIFNYVSRSQYTPIS